MVVTPSGARLEQFLDAPSRLRDGTLRVGVSSTPTGPLRIIDAQTVVPDFSNYEFLQLGQTDRVYEVTTLSRSASEPPPSVGMRWPADYVDCLVKRGTEFVIVPNLTAIFDSQKDRISGANN